jgi:uncharacterized protein YqgQ
LEVAKKFSINGGHVAEEKKVTKLPFASAEGLRKTIDFANLLHDRITSLTFINVELTRMLIESGHLDRERYLKILDRLADLQIKPDREAGAKYTHFIKDLIEKQTADKSPDDSGPAP